MSKVLVIGLDGAPLELVEPWAAAGKLPCLARLMRAGSYGRLESVQPTLSSAAWGSFMTGTNPGKHGLIDFVRREPRSYRLRTLRRDHLSAPTLWQLLSQQGRQVGVMNVPMTYPPEAVNGFIVTGLGTPDFKPFTFPAELGADLLAQGYRVNKRQVFRPGNEEPYLAEVHQMAEGLKKSALRLMRERPWDLFIVVFFDTDQLAHYFWHHMDVSHPAHTPTGAERYANAILNYYQRLDGYIGELTEAAGPDTSVIILSDHGSGPLYKDVLLNEWLKQNGYLVTTPVSRRAGGVRARLKWAGLTRGNVSAMLRRARLGRVEGWIKDALGDRIEVLPRSSRADFPEGIDWTRTRAYSFGYQGQVYINLKGREPQGTVEPGQEYEYLCAELRDKLLALRDPDDGRPVTDRVYLRDDIFSGPCTLYAPDLLLVMRELSYITRAGYEFGAHQEPYITTPHTFETGSHRLHGLCIMSGPGIRSQGTQLAGARLIDIAPTILHLLKCPVSANMDGAVLHGWLAGGDKAELMDYDNSESAAPGADWTEADESELVARLKGLGYLE